MNYKLFSASLLAMAAIGGSAAAQDEGYNWTGAYAGVNLGGAWSSTCSTWTPSVGGVNAVFTGANCPNNSSFIGGGQIGYQYQMQQFVVGLEGDIGGATSHSGTIVETTSGAPGIPAGTYAFSGQHTPSNIETIRLRLGFALDRALIYATGGGAFAGGSSNTVVAFSPADGSGNTAVWTSTNSGTRIGWTIGGGVEYNLTGRWSVRAEDLYMNLGTLSNSPTVCSGAGCATFDQAVTWISNNHAVNVNVFRVGVNYNFGGF